LKRAAVDYKELARWLDKNRLRKIGDLINSKLLRGTFAGTFYSAILAVLMMEGGRLEDL